MKNKLKGIGYCAALLVAQAIGASAATVDFTVFPKGTTPPAGTSGDINIGGEVVSWSLSSTGGPLTYKQSYDGVGTLPDTASGLALVNDGVGIGDDEISANASTGAYETLILTFSQAVYVTGFHFLDMYMPKDMASDPSMAGNIDSDGIEKAVISWDGGSDSIFFAANQLDGAMGGYLYGDPSAPDSGTGMSIFTTQLIFRAGPGNDGNGFADFSLAAVDVELTAVPIPAGGILLLTALGGLGFAHRRRKG